MTVSDDLSFKSALELRQFMCSGELSPITLMRSTLDRLMAAEPYLNAFVNITADEAMKAAYQAEGAINKGKITAPLIGLPVSVKDLIDVAGVPTHFGSRSYSMQIPAIADSPCVEQLKEAMSCIVGKTTTSEFGCKPVGESPLTGITKNPWNTTKTSGGSSAGAASSVAAGITPFAVGTDGGGSIRIPASFCGLIGIKPQFGRIPIFPASATPELAHVGVLARTVRDAALLLTVLSGSDKRDPNSSIPSASNYLDSCDMPVKGMRIAWSRTLGYARPSDEVVLWCERAVNVFSELGCEVFEVDKVIDDPYPQWSTIFYSKVAQRYKEQLSSMYSELDGVIAEKLISSSKITADIIESHYRQTLRLRKEVELFFEDYDLLVTPTTPVTAIDASYDTTVIPPFLAVRKSRVHATISGGLPPLALWGRR